MRQQLVKLLPSIPIRYNHRRPLPGDAIVRFIVTPRPIEVVDGLQRFFRLIFAPSIVLVMFGQVRAVIIKVRFFKFVNDLNINLFAVHNSPLSRLANLSGTSSIKSSYAKCVSISPSQLLFVLIGSTQ